MRTGREEVPLTLIGAPVAVVIEIVAALRSGRLGDADQRCFGQSAVVDASAAPGRVLDDAGRAAARHVVHRRVAVVVQAITALGGRKGGRATAKAQRGITRLLPVAGAEGGRAQTRSAVTRVSLEAGAGTRDGATLLRLDVALEARAAAHIAVEVAGGAVTAAELTAVELEALVSGCRAVRVVLAGAAGRVGHGQAGQGRGLPKADVARLNLTLRVRPRARAERGRIGDDVRTWHPTSATGLVADITPGRVLPVFVDLPVAVVVLIVADLRDRGSGATPPLHLVVVGSTKPAPHARPGVVRDRAGGVWGLDAIVDGAVAVVVLSVARLWGRDRRRAHRPAERHGARLRAIAGAELVLELARARLPVVLGLAHARLGERHAALDAPHLLTGVAFTAALGRVAARRDAHLLAVELDARSAETLIVVGAGLAGDGRGEHALEVIELEVVGVARRDHAEGRRRRAAANPRGMGELALAIVAARAAVPVEGPGPVSALEVFVGLTVAVVVREVTDLRRRAWTLAEPALTAQAHAHALASADTLVLVLARLEHGEAIVDEPVAVVVDAVTELGDRLRVTRRPPEGRVTRRDPVTGAIAGGFAAASLPAVLPLPAGAAPGRGQTAAGAPRRLGQDAAVVTNGARFSVRTRRRAASLTVDLDAGATGAVEIVGAGGAATFEAWHAEEYDVCAGVTRQRLAVEAVRAVDEARLRADVARRTLDAVVAGAVAVATASRAEGARLGSWRVAIHRVRDGDD